ncbi:unnamed protein product [Clonostachys rosea]|uniref:Uncharacterized protein n=1 Tax=Bionectria ochroleuca TaxID=29856 RepID=A0ABY6ULD5_BIOOC|nr:unnamed protein product [Clonostachys rosea]
MNREAKTIEVSEPTEGIFEEKSFEPDQTEAPNDCGVVQFRVARDAEHVDEATECGQELTASTQVNDPVRKTGYEILGSMSCREIT